MSFQFSVFSFQFSGFSDLRSAIGDWRFYDETLPSQNLSHCTVHECIENPNGIPQLSPGFSNPGIQRDHLLDPNGVA